MEMLRYRRKKNELISNMQAKSHADSIGQGKMGSSVEVVFNFELIVTVPELLGFSQRPLFFLPQLLYSCFSVSLKMFGQTRHDLTLQNSSKAFPVCGNCWFCGKPAPFEFKRTACFIY